LDRFGSSFTHYVLFLSQEFHMDTSGITIVGLGPGDARLLTRQAWDLLEHTPEVYLRTRMHPAVGGFPAGLTVHSFDDLYEQGGSFEGVYQKIIDQVLSLGRRPQGVIYAVPGHPFVAEATTPEIVRKAREEGLPYQIVAGLSFLDVIFSTLEIDPLPELATVDALALADLHHPSFPPSTAVYPDEHPVKLVHAAGTEKALVEELPLYAIDRSPSIGLLTALYLPPLGKHTSFESFQELVAHLRAPEGCPWDREQTHQSLRSHLLEETYEVLAALDADDPLEMREELGDLLLQIVLHAQIACEYGEFSMTDILQDIHNKLVYRHPHVFGDLHLEDTQAILQNWERLKAAERQSSGKSEKSLLDGVGITLPALVQANEYQQRAARVGFDWQDIQGVMDKVLEEFREIQQAVDHEHVSREVGDYLFSAVNLARWLDVDAESVLREANHRFRKRFATIEATARQRNQEISSLSPEEMDALWEAAKQLPDR
jgi:tetrapyrrole methylase family protein/MazG family protein